MHYSLLLCENRFHQEVTTAILAENLTPGVPKILEYVANNPGCNQNQIAKGCCINKASTAGILKRMGAAGLIEKQVPDGNRRSYHVYLSDQGKREYNKIKEIFKQVESLSLRGVSEDDLKTCIRVLNKIYDNLETGGINE